MLVVQGGPGTGKTAVGLHRASWLLFTHARRLRREGVLIVGPNRTFIEYVSHVLPSLGETSVVQRAIGDLREGSSPEVRDETAVERRKGDADMAETLREAVEAHRREPGQQLEAMLGMNYVRVPLAQVREIAEEAWRTRPAGTPPGSGCGWASCAPSTGRTATSSARRACARSRSWRRRSRRAAT